MENDIRQLQREIELLHIDLPYDSMAVAINKVLSSNVPDSEKLTRIECYIDVYFDELRDTESDYL